MARFLIALGADEEFRRSSRYLATTVRHVLEGLVKCNEEYLRLKPNLPLLYDSGVRYQEEPAAWKIEEFADIPTIYRRLWGDCDDLAPALCAQIRVREREAATIRLTWQPKNVRAYFSALRRYRRTHGPEKGARLAYRKTVQNKGRLFHVTVRRPNGAVEDPSRVLGMR